MIKKLLKAIIPDILILKHWYKVNPEPERLILNQLVKPSTISIDIGASVGVYSYALSKLVGKKGQVIAIEPFPENTGFLRSASRFFTSPVHIEECCLSSSDGTSFINYPLFNDKVDKGYASLQVKFQGETSKKKVTTRKLDSLMEKYNGEVSFIKCDVEGHELEVIKGALKTIGKHKPNLLIEIEQRHIDIPIQEVFGYIISLGYSGYFLDNNNQIKGIDEFDLDTHQPFFQPGETEPAIYINNFIFKPSAIR